MNVKIIGTGKIARAISTRLFEGGNHVTLVGPAPGKDEELVEDLKQIVKGGGNISVPKEKTIPGDVVILVIPAKNQFYGCSQARGLTSVVETDLTVPHT